MNERLLFYLTYALRNIMRGGRWTTLAIFCITAGVATVVALRTLGLSIGDTLIQNVRYETKGDLLVFNDGLFTGLGGGDVGAFDPWRLERVIEYVEGEGGKVVPFATGNNMQITRAQAETFGRPSFIGSYFIDPTNYPPTHQIRALDPAGVPLEQLLTGGNDVVISDNLASQSDLHVGDTVRVSGTDALYTVRGIVSATEETSIFNLLNGFFGFAYFDIENARAVINDQIGPNRFGIIFPQPLSYAETAQLTGRVQRMTGWPGVLNPHTLLRRYKVISQYVNDFIVTMGLGALLIGGVGIMNTMLVLVRRRTNEIAAVKTFGVKGHEVAKLFLTEALLLGLIGSVLGMIVGIGLSVIVNQYGSVALQQPLLWRVYPEALFFGLVLGVMVTGIFGVAPILTAVKIRPAIILRPNENHFAALGVLQSFALLLFVTISLGLIVGQIVRPSFELTRERLEDMQRTYEQLESANDNNNDENRPLSRREQLAQVELPSPYVAGVLGVGGTFLFFGILIGGLWVLVWIVGKIPTFGNVTGRLALRNLSTNRLRTATTLLALIAGMFALSSIAFAGEGTRELLNVQLSQTFGGNVLVFPFPGAPENLVNLALDDALSDVDIEYSTTISNFGASLATINGFDIEGDPDMSFTVWDSDKPDIYSAQTQVLVGRMLTLEDRGQPVVTVPEETALFYNLGVGTIVRVIAYDAGTFDLEVVGVTTNGDGIPSPTGSMVVVPPGVLPDDARPRFTLYTYQIPEAQVNQALTELSEILLALSLDVSFLDSLVGRLIDQFAAIPTIVALLSLFAASVIMANTVALSTLERRRQIGILKAIGLKSRDVLKVMLVESTIVGLMSAILGIGISVLLMTILSKIGGILIPIPTDARLAAVGLVVASVLIGWMATFLSARVAINERVMNVLRYE